MDNTKISILVHHVQYLIFPLSWRELQTAASFVQGHRSLALPLR